MPTQPLERQDLAIAELVLEEGRGLVVAVNKWDAWSRTSQGGHDASARPDRAGPAAGPGPAGGHALGTAGRSLDRLLACRVQLYEAWNSRVPTGELNRFWLEAMVSAHPPPAPAGRRIRLKYMTQAKARPPTFALFASQADALPESYLRYLENGLREAFDLKGTPIRIQLRTGKNPYATKG